MTTINNTVVNGDVTNSQHTQNQATKQDEFINNDMLRSSEWVGIFSVLPREIQLEIVEKMDEVTKARFATSNSVYQKLVVDQTKTRIKELIQFFVNHLGIKELSHLVVENASIFTASGLKGIKQGLPELKRELLAILSQASPDKLRELKSPFNALEKPTALNSLLELAICLAELRETLEKKKDGETENERDAFVERTCLSLYANDVDTAVQAAERIVAPAVKSGVLLQICTFLYGKQRNEECFQLADKLTDQDKAQFISLVLKTNHVRSVEKIINLCKAIQDPTDRQKMLADLFETLAGIDLDSALVFAPKDPCELKDCAFEGIAKYLVSQNKINEALEYTDQINDTVCRSRLLFHIAKEQKIRGLYDEAIEAIRLIPSNYIKSAALTDLLTHSLNLSHPQLMRIVTCANEISDLANKKNVLSMMLIFIEKELFDDELLSAIAESSKSLDNDLQAEILENIDRIKNRQL